MEPEASELRRSVRERRATTVKYNGFAVRVRAMPSVKRKGGLIPRSGSTIAASPPRRLMYSPYEPRRIRSAVTALQ